MSTTSRVLPGLGITGGWAAGENGWADGVNANWLAISVYTQARALNIVDTLPTSPTQGDVYLLSEAATAKAGSVAAYDNSAWSYFTPQTGFEFYVASKSAVYRYNGTTWTAASSGGGDYTLPAATATSLGGIKVGSGLTVSKDGMLSASSSTGQEPNSSQGYQGSATSGNTSASYSALILAESSLISYFPLNDAIGSTTVKDNKGTNDAAVNPLFLLGISGRLDATCGFCMAPSPKGSKPSIGLNVPTNIIGDDFTIEMWAHITGLSSSAADASDYYTGDVLVGYSVPGTTNDLAMSLGQYGYILAGTGNPNTTINGDVKSSIMDGRWHHVVFTRTKATGTLTLYVDGVSVATGTGGTQTLDALTSIPMACSQGYFADIAFYSSALASADVASHYAAGKAH